MISDETIRILNNFVDFIPVCPECEVGMGVPRQPVRLVLSGNECFMIQPSTGEDFSERMELFSKKFLSGISENSGIHGIILKFKSPSCGPSNVKIYQGMDKASRSIKGSGFFASRVRDFFPALPMEDEGRLKNFSIREGFYIHIFTISDFENVMVEGNISELVKFHSRNKYLFMALNQELLRKMGRIVANHGKRHFTEICSEYLENLQSILSKPLRFTAVINAVQHMFGYVSQSLCADERKYFLDLIEEYRDERIPLSVLVKILKGMAIRFNAAFILDQTMLEPYPLELVDITDSGKGRKL
jgi:uncharacterized protein YbgA (DUF1722 family)/uncharacterized protein YbbK (DUF523 family)